MNDKSAVLDGAHAFGITADHRDMVKFESIQADRFAPIERALSKMIGPAKVNVRKRLQSSGQSLLNQKFVNQVRRSLEGVDMRQRFRTKTEQKDITSWLTSEELYQHWLESAVAPRHERLYLWLTGGPGLGKTNAALTAVQRLSDKQLAQQNFDSSRSRTEHFVAYFLCDPTSGHSTAEDVMKNLIVQLINQEDSLAQHAKWFAQHHRANVDDAQTSGVKATATVDNLWKCLQDMIEDPAIGNVHFIISNLHCLESGESTTALLAKLSEDASTTSDLPETASKAKWLLTSRKDVHIGRYLSKASVAVIDLENNEEYGGKLTLARREHARKAILDLRTSQNYTTDLAYFISNSIQSQSEDETWIDVLCILLKSQPKQSSNRVVARWLREAAGLGTDKLINHAWDEVSPAPSFRKNL